MVDASSNSLIVTGLIGSLAIFATGLLAQSDFTLGFVVPASFSPFAANGILVSRLVEEVSAETIANAESGLAHR